MTDPYRAIIADRDKHELRSPMGVGLLTIGTIAGLLERSGANMVSSAVLHGRRNERACADEYAIHFDSRAWTGR